MLRAETEGVTPEKLISLMYNEHLRDFTNFHIKFDNYYTTHSPETSYYSKDIYNKLKDAGLIAIRNIEQFYDPVKNMFLPDRFIKGECPKCSAKDQYGDNCEACGAAYAPNDLINPYSVISGTPPITKNSEHFFFRLSDHRCIDFLRCWTNEADHLQPEVANKMQEWLGGRRKKLSDWDISRDAPYFGFEIPDAPGKYFYVWLDAPIGYMGSFKNFARKITSTLMNSGEKMRPQNCIILSVRTYYIFMHYSGQQCLKIPGIVYQQKFLPMAFSP